MSSLSELNLNVEEEAKLAGEFAPLPEGEYDVVITSSEMKNNRTGQGCHVAVTMQVVEGDMVGRLVFENYNVSNPNPVAERLGRAELAALCQAMGLSNPKDTDELKDKPFRVKLGIDKKDPTRTRVKTYMTTTGPAANPAPTPAAKPTPPPSAATPGRKPWEKR